LSGLRSNDATEEEGLIREIQQHNGVRLVEFPLTRGHDSKRGSQVREERMERCDESAKGAKGVLYIGGGAR
jgi:hypothetical protein